MQHVFPFSLLPMHLFTRKFRIKTPLEYFISNPRDLTIGWKRMLQKKLHLALRQQIPRLYGSCSKQVHFLCHLSPCSLAQYKEGIMLCWWTKRQSGHNNIVLICMCDPFSGRGDYKVTSVVFFSFFLWSNSACSSITRKNKHKSRAIMPLPSVAAL